MKNNLEKIGQVYKDICNYCFKHEEGLTIRQLKKEYQISKHDLRVLFQFSILNDLVFDDPLIYFSIVDNNGENVELQTNLKESEELNKKVDKNVDELMNKVEDDWKISIFDSIYILRDKVQPEDFQMIGKISMQGTGKSNIKQKMLGIGTVPEELFVVDKNMTTMNDEHKSIWIQCILYEKCILMNYAVANNKINRKVVRPVGMYHDRLLEKYYGVFMEQSGQLNDIDLCEVRGLKDTKEHFDSDCSEFDIDEYRSEISIHTQMVLRVYNEGKVQQKLSKLLRDNQLVTEDFGEYMRYSFQTRDEWLYAEKLKQYGRSVIIEKPDCIRQAMEKDIIEALAFYDIEDSF